MKKFFDFLEEELGLDPGLVLLIFFIVIVSIGVAVVNGGQLSLFQVLGIAVFLSPIWLPLTLVLVLWDRWITYAQVKYRMNTEYTLLEIRLPEEITRTPLAMETVVNVLYFTGSPQDWYDGIVLGESRPQFSLEIVSFEGDVRFFIRTPTKNREMLESQIYSQYSTVEIFEVEDYAEKIQYNPQTMDLFGMETKLAKPDPYPIKTYVDWGLDKPGLKEEEKIDPMNSITEFLGSLGKGEYCFLQIIVRSHVPDKMWGDKQHPDWQKVAQKEVDDIIKKLQNNKKSKEQTFTMYRVPTEEEKNIMESLQRNVAKKPFETGIRILYFGPKEAYKSIRHAAIPTMFRTFQSHSLNNIKPVFRTSFNWWLGNPFGLVKKRRQREIFQAYRWRSFFIPPYERPFYVLSSEELATLYHFPSRATATPTLQRTPSRKAEAPPNLPR